MLEFEKPGYLYLLLVLVVLAGLFFYAYRWQRKKQAEFGNRDMIKRLVPNRSAAISFLKSVLALGGVAAIIIALANPVEGKRLETVKQQGIDVVFAIDVSKSMLAEDVAPNRLEKSKQIVSEIINLLGTDRVGIIGYAGSAYPVLPITSDFGIAKMYLQSMNTNMVSSQGTAIGDAIKLSTTYFDNPAAGKVLILISDGEDHGEDAEKAAGEASDKGIRVITVGVGTEEGGPIPLKEDGITRGLKRDSKGETVITSLYPDHLSTIAGLAKGEYVEGTNTKQAAAKVKKALSTILKTEYESKRMAGLDPQFQWPAALALLLLAIDTFLSNNKFKWSKLLTFAKRK